MTPLSEHLACPDCDSLFIAPQIQAGEWVICPRCGANIFSARHNWMHRATALVCSAGFFFVLANLFPFLTLQADYRENDMRLMGSVSGLDAQGFPILAALVGVFTIAAPTLLIGAMLYILVPLLHERRLPGAVLVCRAIHEARRWSMTEVFLLGVLVSLIKLGKVATLTLGPSFWAFVGLIICLTGALATLDHRELWTKLEAARP